MDPFTALADPVRRALLRRLAEGNARVVDLAAEHPVSRPAISRHLKVLADAGLVSAEDHGRERHYVLVREGLGAVRDLLQDLASKPRFSESVLDALDLEVRRTVKTRQDAQTPTTVEETA